MRASTGPSSPVANLRPSSGQPTASAARPLMAPLQSPQLASSPPPKTYGAPSRERGAFLPLTVSPLANRRSWPGVTTPPSARACTPPRILLSLGESSLIARSKLWCLADDRRLMTHSPASTRAVGLPCLSTPWKPSTSVVPGPERGSRYPAGVPNKPPAANPTTPPAAFRAEATSG